MLPEVGKTIAFVEDVTMASISANGVLPAHLFNRLRQMTAMLYAHLAAGL